MEIFVPKDCGNAPRKLVLIDFVTNVVKQNIEVLHEHITEHIEWHNVATNQLIRGRKQFLDEVKMMNIEGAKSLRFAYVITHGKTTSVNGTLFFDGAKLHFNDVIEFSQAGNKGKIKKVISFWIKEYD